MLVSLKPLMEDAMKKGYAVGAPPDQNQRGDRQQLLFRKGQP